MAGPAPAGWEQRGRSGSDDTSPFSEGEARRGVAAPDIPPAPEEAGVNSKRRLFVDGQITDSAAPDLIRGGTGAMGNDAGGR